MSIRQYIDSMTPERILKLAARPQGIRVHRYRYREEKIARRVKALVDAGKLRLVSKDREECTYQTVKP